MIHVVSVSTHDSIGGRNFMASLKKQGYSSIHILARGKKWGGWSWRTKEYLQFLSEQPDNKDVYVLVDSNDLFFVGPPNKLLQSFYSYQSDLVISAESNQMITSDYLDAYYGLRSKSIFRYPNAGCIIGYRSALLKLLKMNQDAPDDQKGILDKVASGMIQATLDNECRIAVTIPFASRRPDYLFHQFSDHKNFRVNPDKTVTCLPYGTSPVILHFPGKVPFHYNTFLLSIYPDLQSLSVMDFLWHILKEYRWIFTVGIIMVILCFYVIMKK